MKTKFESFELECKYLNTEDICDCKRATMTIKNLKTEHTTSFDIKIDKNVNIDEEVGVLFCFQEFLTKATIGYEFATSFEEFCEKLGYHKNDMKGKMFFDECVCYYLNHFRRVYIGYPNCFLEKVSDEIETKINL